jgi:hypothetical protein
MATQASEPGPERSGPKDDLFAELRSSLAFLLSIVAILVLIDLLGIALS